MRSASGKLEERPSLVSSKAPQPSGSKVSSADMFERLKFLEQRIAKLRLIQTKLPARQKLNSVAPLPGAILGATTISEQPLSADLSIAQPTFHQMQQYQLMLASHQNSLRNPYYLPYSLQFPSHFNPHPVYYPYANLGGYLPTFPINGPYQYYGPQAPPIPDCYGPYTLPQLGRQDALSSHPAAPNLASFQRSNSEVNPSNARPQARHPTQPVGEPQQRNFSVMQQTQSLASHHSLPRLQREYSQQQYQTQPTSILRQALPQPVSPVRQIQAVNNPSYQQMLVESATGEQRSIVEGRAVSSQGAISDSSFPARGTAKCGKVPVLTPSEGTLLAKTESTVAKNTSSFAAANLTPSLGEQKKADLTREREHRTADSTAQTNLKCTERRETDSDIGQTNASRQSGSDTPANPLVVGSTSAARRKVRNVLKEQLLVEADSDPDLDQLGAAISRASSSKAQPNEARNGSSSNRMNRMGASSPDWELSQSSQQLETLPGSVERSPKSMQAEKRALNASNLVYRSCQKRTLNTDVSTDKLTTFLGDAKGLEQHQRDYKLGVPFVKASKAWIQMLKTQYSFRNGIQVLIDAANIGAEGIDFFSAVPTTHVLGGGPTRTAKQLDQNGNPLSTSPLPVQSVEELRKSIPSSAAILEVSTRTSAAISNIITALETLNYDKVCKNVDSVMFLAALLATNDESRAYLPSNYLYRLERSKLNLDPVTGRLCELTIEQKRMLFLYFIVVKVIIAQILMKPIESGIIDKGVPSVMRNHYFTAYVLYRLVRLACYASIPSHPDLIKQEFHSNICSMPYPPPPCQYLKSNADIAQQRGALCFYPWDLVKMPSFELVDSASSVPTANPLEYANLELVSPEGKLFQDIRNIPDATASSADDSNDPANLQPRAGLTPAFPVEFLEGTVGPLSDELFQKLIEKIPTFKNHAGRLLNLSNAFIVALEKAQLPLPQNVAIKDKSKSLNLLATSNWAVDANGYPQASAPSNSSTLHM